MPDVDRDPQVAYLLDEVGATVAPHLAPPGVDSVYTTVRHRRRNRVVAAGVLAAALLAGPSVGFALANDGDRATPPVGGDPSATAPPQSPSTSPSASPSASTPPPPDGRISLGDLKRARLDLPPWPPAASSCERSDVTFLGEPVHSDVDGDGAQETVALLSCQGNGEFRLFKVMAFDRDRAGKIVTFGQVLETTSPEPGGIAKVWGIEAGTGGQVRVDVGDYYPCCDTAPDLPQHQWRTYGWNGERFTQTGGPTTFGPNPKITDLRISAGDLVMSRQQDGTWRGTLRFTVRNAGPFPAWVTVSVSGERLKAAGDGWSGWSDPPDGGETIYATRAVGDLAAGTSRAFTLDVTSTTAPSGKVHVGAHHEMEGESRGYPDKRPTDNIAEVAIRAA